MFYSTVQRSNRRQLTLGRLPRSEERKRLNQIPAVFNGGASAALQASTTEKCDDSYPNVVLRFATLTFSEFTPNVALCFAIP